MTTSFKPSEAILAPREGVIALVVESVVSAASVVWWTCLLWARRGVLYAVPVPTVVILTVVLSLLVTWALWLRGRRLQRLNLALIAVRGVTVLTLSLWIFQEL